MEIIKNLQKYGASYSVLYVEDDQDTRAQVVDFFQKIFGKITIAQDGQEGLEKFKTVRPDLVVTDVQMPKMDGLTMTAKIKEIDTTTPIVITTAHNDESYFLESIRLGIDRYVLKPIKIMDFSQALMDIFIQLDDQKKARAYEKKLVQEKIQSNAQQVISNLANSYPMPTMVFKKGELIFLNDAFLELLDESTLNKVQSDPEEIDLALLHQDGYAASLFETGPNTKVLIRTRQGKRVFQVHHHNMNTVDDTTATQVIVLGDVTHLEQSRQSQRHYNRYLQEVIKKGVQQRDWKAEKNRILHESHQKISAQEYLTALEAVRLEKAEEIKKSTHGTEHLLERYCQQSTRHHLDELILGLQQIAVAIAALGKEFEPLKEALADVGEALSETVSGDLLPIMVEHYLVGIFNDLKSWYQDVFVSQTCEDIHLYDVDILSGCVNFQMALTQGEKADFLLEGPGIKL